MFRNFTKLFVALLIFYIVSLTMVLSFNFNRISQNANNGIKLIQQEGLWPKLFFNNSDSGMLDNYTDKVMLEKSLISYKQYGNNPLKAAMDVGNYGRYWHGYEIILRPLLFLFSYYEIRYLNVFLVFALFVSSLFLIVRQIDYKACLSFFVAMMCIKLFLVPMCLQFSNLIIIMFISLFVLNHYILKNNLSMSNSHHVLLYFVFCVGSLTAFFDLLTTPILPIGMILLYAVLVNYKKYGSVLSFVYLFKALFTWEVGYGLTWISKWFIATLICPKNYILDGISNFIYRSSSNFKGSEAGAGAIDRILMLKRNIHMLSWPIGNYKTISIIILLFIIWLILFHCCKNKNINYAYILDIIFISLLPFAWYLFAANHSQLHYWFTYRSLAVTVFGLSYIMLYLLDTNELKLWINRRIEYLG